MRQGRPLRFLVLVLAGWTAARMAMLAPVPPSLTPPPPIRWVAAHAAPIRTTTLRHAVATSRSRPMIVGIAAATQPSRPLIPRAAPTATLPDAVIAAPPAAAPVAGIDIAHPGPAPLPPPVTKPTHGRLRIDGWLLARADGAGTPLTPQLGGAQAGVRIAYALHRAHRLAVFARAATPLRTGDPEAAAGVQYRLPHIPLTAFAELRRVANQPLAPGLGVFGGVDRPLGRLRLTGYAQGGYAGGRGRTLYADGQLGLTRPLARLGPARVSGGVGAWGAAQRGVARLDVGPGLAVAHGPFRVGLDWRLRVGGDARPGSGPALTLVGSF